MISHIFSRTGIFLLCSAVLVGCSKPEQLAPAVPPVQTLVLQQGTTQSFRRFPGEVAAVETFEMSFDVAGRMIERPAREGMNAMQGELLAKLDPVNFEARVTAANARLVNARDELARRRQLRDRGVISASELDQFTTDFHVAEAEQREAQRALEDTMLVAPINGRVARTMVNNNTSVQPKQPILVFQDISMLEVQIEVPEQVMTMLAQGITTENAREMIEGKVEFPAIPGRVFDLTLRSFNSEATEVARTFRINFYLQPPADANILPGMTCTVLVRARGASAPETEVGVFEVPSQTIGTLDGATILWRLSPETMTVSAIPIELIGPAGQSMRIRSLQLQPKDEVVVSGVRFLAEGMQVNRMAAPSR